jgi:hypothetical protein
MGVDADASTAGVVDAFTSHAVDTDFNVSINVRVVGTAWIGWQASLQYDPSILEWVPTFDSDGSTTNDCWTYTALGGVVITTCPNTQFDRDGDFVNDTLFGGASRLSGTSTATGQAAVVTFHCLAPGISPLHLRTLLESAPSFGTKTFAAGGVTLGTDLTHASVECQGVTGPQTGSPAARSLVGWVSRLWATLTREAALQ